MPVLFLLVSLLGIPAAWLMLREMSQRARGRLDSSSNWYGVVDVSHATARERAVWFVVLAAGFFWVEFFLGLAMHGTRHVLLDVVVWLVASLCFAGAMLVIALWRLIHRS